MVDKVRGTFERNSWWISLVLMCFVGILSFLGAWQFERVANFPETYQTKIESKERMDAHERHIAEDIKEVNTRQIQLENKIDRVGDKVSEVKTLLIQMKNKE